MEQNAYRKLYNNSLIRTSPTSGKFTLRWTNHASRRLKERFGLETFSNVNLSDMSDAQFRANRTKGKHVIWVTREKKEFFLVVKREEKDTLTVITVTPDVCARFQRISDLFPN